MFDRRMAPLFVAEEISPPVKASQLTLAPCDPGFARSCVAAWHSRLPYTQAGPWRLAFAAHHEWTCYGVALWHNPSARGLPQSWLELRRLAIAPDAPHCTASYMLGGMARWIARNWPEVTMLISYQDEDVHTGTIYRAAGWIPAYRSKPRVRDRSKPRRGTRRSYRSNSNGVVPDSAGKIRWQKPLTSTHALGAISRSSAV